MQIVGLRLCPWEAVGCVVWGGDGVGSREA